MKPNPNHNPNTEQNTGQNPEPQQPDPAAAENVKIDDPLVHIKDLFNRGAHKAERNVSFQIEEVPTDGPVTGRLNFYSNPTGFTIRGYIHGDRILECDRCLNTFIEPFDYDIEERFAYEHYLSPYGEKEKELREEDYYEPIAQNGVLDLRDFARQIIIMENPGPYYCMNEQCEIPKAVNQ